MMYKPFFFYQLYQQVITPTSLPFYGEPLRGVQLMGMLETRTLDFENLIILSCNEDMLPSGKINTSFIPFDLKRSFGLPTYRHKDAVYAYHFYRLIQRAKQVWILFNTEPDQLGGGDRSRYLRQIASELPVYNPKIVITERVLATPPGKREPVAAIRIPKTGQTAEALEAKAAKGFSATALNLYRNCPLKFYFSEIAGIKEPDDLEDTIDPAILGSAVHEALFSLFKPCLNCVITADFIHEMEKRSDDAVDLAFEKKFKGSDTAYGKNLLFVNVAKLMVRRFLKAEAEQFRDPEQPGKPVSIAFLEQYLDTIVQVPFGDKILDVKIKGFLDRVDQSDRGWKIIDYKTGVTEPKQVKVRDWGELAGNPDLNIAFQLLLYGYLLNRRFKDAITCSAGIISLKKIKTGFMAVAVPAPEPGKFSTILDRGTLALFEKVMEHILGEIYDAEIPFDQTDNPDLCERCPYINLCCR